MKNRNFTDEQLDSVIEYLEDNTYSLEDALQEVLEVSIDELSHEDYKYIIYDIARSERICKRKMEMVLNGY